MEPKDFLFEDNDTSETVVENDNYKNLAIVGYLINFGLPLLQFMLIIGMGGYISGMAGLLYMSILFLTGAALYVLGLIFLFGLISDKSKKHKNKTIKTSIAQNMGIVIFFFPLFLILLLNAIYTLPFFK